LATVRAARNALICNCAVIEPVDAVFEFFQAEVKTSTAWQELMLHIWDARLLTPSRRRIAGIGTEVCAFGEDEQPCRIQASLVLSPQNGTGMSCRQLSEAMLQTRLILRPFPAHEDEVVEHHAGTDHGDVFQTLFQDDVDVAMASGSVGDPP
jgi:hypothetical protein